MPLSVKLGATGVGFMILALANLSIGALIVYATLMIIICQHYDNQPTRRSQ